ncbi:MAG: hypothetical protein HYY25_04895 [Candidatus Wallbacteria bacterium]|nr:hypothetical protein [Candidatus Wallbacteria bacterium]
MRTNARASKWTAAAMAFCLAFLWGVMPLAAQDAGDAATQQFMQERLAALRTQQERMAQEYQSIQQSDPARAEYLARLMAENQALEQRYVARLQGQPLPQDAAAQPQGSQPGAPAPAPGGEEQGGIGGMLKNMMGGGETNTTDIIISIVSGLGGWYLGKMAFGPIGGIVGGIVAPMLAKWLTGKVREMMNRDKGPAGGVDPNGGGYTPYVADPTLAQSAHGAPVYTPQKAAAQSADIANAKAQMDAAYLSLQDGIQRNLTPAEIAQRRNTFEQWQLVYNQALGAGR